jgi:ABC-2 type transport system permease protein
MKEIRLAKTILLTLARDQMHYPSTLFASFIEVMTRCGVLLVLYSYVFHLRGGSINGTTFQTAAWSMFFYFIILILQLRYIAHLIMKDVQSGNIEVLFSKPISYLSYRMWWQAGSHTYTFVMTFAIIGAALALCVGIPPSMHTALFIPTWILTSILGCILTLIIFSIIGLLAFWMEDINPVRWIVDKTILILGGSYFPVTLFPPLLYMLSVCSPFGASYFVTYTVTDAWASRWPFFIGMQMLWIAILGCILYVLFQKVKVRISVNGG